MLWPLSCGWLWRTSLFIRLLPLGVRNGQSSPVQSPPAPRSAPQPSPAPHGPRVTVPRSMTGRENRSVPGPPAHVPVVQQMGMLLRGLGDKIDVLGLEAEDGPGSSGMLCTLQLPSHRDGGTHQLSVKWVQGEPESHSTPLTFGNRLHPMGVLAA